jgi:ATP-binding cassette subfamily B protein
MPYWPLVAGSFLLSLLSTPLSLLAPVPLKIAIDSVLGNKPVPGVVDAVLPDAVNRSDVLLLAAVASMLVIITVVIQAHSLVNSLLGTYAGERLVLDVRAKLFAHAQRLSLSYHDSKGSSDSVYRIQYDVTALQALALSSVTSIVTSALTLAAMLYVTARLDWQLAAIALTILPLLLAVSQAYRRRLRHQSREVKRLESSQLSIIQEVLGAVRVVKAFGQEDRESERFVRRSREGMRARVRLEISEAGFGLLLGLLTSVGTAAVLYLGVRHVQSGALTLGELTLVMAYLSQLYSPLKTISKKMASLQGSLASAERTFELLDADPEVQERTHARSLKRARGAVEYRGVSFSYDGRKPVLDGVSFVAPPGTRVGIAGRTGAGKTTLVNLLMRFYDPDAGDILLDGVDLRDFRLRDLREQFAIVLQEPLLFSTSIAENIAYARPGARFDDIVVAAKAANAHDFIMRLPNGYDTPVGERGMMLSGGERQRISLSRAFLKDAPILILDEPTSSVDVKTEAVIMEAMDRLMDGRTTFMIAHRLGTLDYCDVILQLESGRLAEQRIVEDPSDVAVSPPAAGQPAGTVGAGERLDVQTGATQEDADGVVEELLGAVIVGLTRGLDDPVPVIRQRSREALLSDRRRVSQWIRSLLRSGDNGEAIVAARAAEAIAPEDLVGDLLDRAAREAPGTRSPFLRALEASTLDGPGLVRCTLSMEPALRAEAVSLIRTLRGREILQAMQATLADASDGVRLSGLELLAAQRDPAAIDLAGRVLREDPSPVVRSAAVRVLGEIVAARARDGSDGAEASDGERGVRDQERAAPNRTRLSNP